MIDLSRHIEYLLLTDTEVQIQQLGIFRAQCMPSRWVEDEHLLLPPYRTLHFEAKADVDDTRLLHTLALKYKLSMQEAEIKRTEYVEHLKQELQENGSADLGNIGVFVCESEGSELLFIPCEAGVTTPAYYGLDALHLEPLPQHEHRAKIKGRTRALHTNNDEDYFVIRIPKRALHYAASVAAAAVLFFAASTPIAEQAASGEQTAHTTFFVPSHLMSQPACQPVTQTSAKEDILLENVKAEDTPLEEAVSAAEMVNEVVVPQTAEVPVAVQSEGPTYAVVLASAIPMQRAEAYAKELNSRGIQAEARQFGKIVRVIIPGFTTAEEVQERIHELKSHSAEFEGAWTLKVD